MRLIPVVLCVVFAGCSGSPAGSLVAPTGARVSPTGDGGATSSGAPTLTVDQSTVYFGCNFPASFTVTTTSNSPGAVTAVVDFAGNCSVSPDSEDASVTPGGGGAKHASFTITALNPSSCNVTLTDKKGNKATVAVRSNGDGSCWV